MKVKKRDGTLQDLDFEKIHWRIKSICVRDDILEFQKQERPDAYKVFKNLEPLNINSEDIDIITKKTIDGIYNGISTSEIDILSAEIAQEMCTTNPLNSKLATRILVSNLQKNILEIMCKRFPKFKKEEIQSNLFQHVMQCLYLNHDQNDNIAPVVAPYMVAIAEKYADRIGNMLDFSRDFTQNEYLGIKTLEKGYLFKVHSMEGFGFKDIIVETPAIANMRTAIGLCCAPIPCPKVYDNNEVLKFLIEHPQVLKPKALNFDNNFIKISVLEELQNTAELYKSRYIKKKEFTQLYWQYQLEQELKTTNIDETTWTLIKNIYDGMSMSLFSCASPTRFSIGTLRPQCSSCFLIAMEDDSLKGIYNTLTEQSQISKFAGGVAIWVTNIRASKSYIASTNGHSDGIKPMLKVFDASTSYANQSGKRDGTVAIYNEFWHGDIEDFLKLKRKKGAESNKAARLFYGNWVSDEYFRCLTHGKEWYLFDPAIVPKLYDSYDEEFASNYLSDEFVNTNKSKFLFTYRYRKYIKQMKYMKVTTAEAIMEEVVETVRDSGVPYMLAKDACNRKSNQKNIGVIKSSNLCTEIIQYSDKNNTAVCNLTSICVNRFIREFKEGDNENFKYNVTIDGSEPVYYTFDFEEFGRIVKLIQQYIDRLIDSNFYPTEKSRTSNSDTRPMGIGIQGEADMFASLRLPWNSKQAHRLRFYIFERMYYECLKSSCEIAKVNGPYKYFKGSPASQGILQFDMWKTEGKKISFAFSLPWDQLKEEIKQHGIRNSLFIAPMPTASTSSIMGNSPAIEPFNSLIYVKKSGTGDITIVKDKLVADLESLGLWNKKIRDKIITDHGSIQNIMEIPKIIRDSYLTAWDLEPEDIIDAAFVRGWFVDQSQSMNLFVKNVTMASLTKAWTRAWMRGLKTLSYYVRSQTATVSQKAQLETEVKPTKPEEDGPVCSRDNPDCVSCGS